MCIFHVSGGTGSCQNLFMLLSWPSMDRIRPKIYVESANPYIAPQEINDARHMIEFRLYMHRYFIFILLVLFIGACSKIQAVTPLPMATAIIMPSETDTPKEPPNSSNLTIDLLNTRDKVIAVTNRNVINIKVPPGFENTTWQVDYAANIVQPLMTIEEAENPASGIWIFRAVTIGQTDIRFTTNAPKCQGEQPCPPAPPRTFVITIDVVK